MEQDGGINSCVGHVMALELPDWLSHSVPAAGSCAQPSTEELPQGVEGGRGSPGPGKPFESHSAVETRS